MPYLYSQAIVSHQTGLPMLRATFLEFPEDRAAWHLDTQYILGDSLLVAPVFSAEGDVEYYIPKGDWYGLLDGKIRTGPGYVKETHDFNSLPVLLRPGSAIVMGLEEGRPDYAWAEKFRLVINPALGMEKEILIPDHEKLGETALTISVFVDNESVKVKVEKGMAGSDWEVVLAGKKVKSVLFDKEQTERKESFSAMGGSVEMSKSNSAVEIFYE